jgi:Protein of unknown function (DUF1579)
MPHALTDKDLIPMPASTAHDFDFLIGDWRVHHTRLRERLVGNHEWQEFDGTCSMRPLLGGSGNADDNLVNLPDGPYHAVSLRAYDPGTQRWAIWWLDARHPHHIDVPVVGGFDDGIGSFFADDVINGQAVRVRFKWLDIHTASPRWEQAFSPDAGKTWEVNWTMRFERVLAHC